MCLNIGDPENIFVGSLLCLFERGHQKAGYPEKKDNPPMQLETWQARSSRLAPGGCRPHVAGLIWVGCWFGLSFGFFVFGLSFGLLALVLL